MTQPYIAPPQQTTAAPQNGLGTAGFTAMQSLLALERHGLRPGGREVLVTGAAGGVGSTAIALLANVGYKVTASTGRPEHHDYLRNLGAFEILDRAALTAQQRPGPYALQAAIAAVHAEALRPEDTDWREIVGLYDLLLAMTPSPITGATGIREFFLHLIRVARSMPE